VDIAFAGPSLNVGFDFHGWFFLSLRICCLLLSPRSGYQQRLQVRLPLVTDSRRRVLARLDTCLDLQSPRHRLVVLLFPKTTIMFTSFHVRFDFHSYISFP
jgi:hypothetical protein